MRTPTQSRCSAASASAADSAAAAAVARPSAQEDQSACSSPSHSGSSRSETGSKRSSTRPVLSLNESRWTPTRSSSVTWRLASGVPFSDSDVPTALQAGGGAARDHDRQILVIVQAGVAHAAAVQIERMIEERAVTVRRVLHALEEVREQRHVEGIDLRDRQRASRDCCRDDWWDGAGPGRRSPGSSDCSARA